MMIDWVSAKIPLSHDVKINGGKFTKSDENGEIEFTNDRFLQVEGSYSSIISLKTLEAGINGKISFSGNPVKFLQGHNLFGSTDLVTMMASTLRQLFASLDIQPSPDNLHDIDRGNYTLSRVDITAMYELSTLADVLAWIRAASYVSRSRHKSSGILKGDTLYWGKNSRRWALKVYAKGQEIKAKDHGLPANLPFREELLKWAENKLRLELVLRGPELKKIGANTAASFCNQNPDKIFHMYRERVSLPENFSLSPELISTLPQSLRSTYVLWQNGDDLRGILKKNTFYSHRSKLRKHGIDILVKPSDRSNTAPLAQVLEAIPVGIPNLLPIVV